MYDPELGSWSPACYGKQPRDGRQVSALLPLGRTTKLKPVKARNVLWHQGKLTKRGKELENLSSVFSHTSHITSGTKSPGKVGTHGLAEGEVDVGRLCLPRFA